MVPPSPQYNKQQIPIIWSKWNTQRSTPRGTMTWLRQNFHDKKNVLINNQTNRELTQNRWLQWSNKSVEWSQDQKTNASTWCSSPWRPQCQLADHHWVMQVFLESISSLLSISTGANTSLNNLNPHWIYYIFSSELFHAMNKEDVDGCNMSALHDFP